MCGIAGIVRFDGAPVDREVLVRMTRTLTHRGPDEEGYWIGPRADVGLGHRRLSIIDLSSGQQPLSNEDGNVWVAFNGEIYNFQALQKELEGMGHRFHTHSDTETIVHAWEEWGDRAVEKFRGMFALALWDDRKRTLWLARDRPGKKPLYYLHDGKRLLFGSELKAILAHPDVPRDVDETALSDYLSLLYVPRDKSIFRAIRKLPAAHTAVVTAQGIRLREYWDLPFTPRHDLDEPRMMDDLLGILDEATRIRRISEVPLGAFLSGGVDSSAIVALMAKQSSEPVITNSIAFSVAAYDESEHARRVAEMFHTDHHEFRVTPEAIPVIEKLAWHYDEPFADSSQVPTYYVSEVARRSVIVALSGDGGDENFAGYRRYFFDLRENNIRNLVPGSLRGPVFGTLGRLYPKADYLPRMFRGKAFISNVARHPVDAYFHSMSSFRAEDKDRAMKPELVRRLDGYRTEQLFHDFYGRAQAEDHLSRLQYLDVKTYLCDDILVKVDRAAMAVSLEVRCPILDHEFMEYVARIPGRLKLRGLEGKYIFKKALKRHLPNDILYRSKMGFGVPVLEWLRKDLRAYAEDHILRGPATREYLEPAFIEKIWKEHGAGIRNRSSELWGVLMLNLWHERFARADASAVVQRAGEPG